MHELDETEKRINRANAQAGGIAFWPEQWRSEIDPMAEALDNDNFHAELPYDAEPVARRMAGHMVGKHIAAWGVGRRWVYEGFCPAPEATLYVLSYAGDPTSVTALRDIQQLQDVKADMKGLWRCNTLITRRCCYKLDGFSAEYPVELLAVKRGEYICVFVACLPCLEHIKSGGGFNDDYIGPDHDWYDDRKVESLDDDPFDL